MKIFPATLTHDGRKVPIVKWKTEASSDPTIISNWQQQYDHIKFWGVPTGPENGFLVLDVDVKGGGLETVKNYHVPTTLSQRTLNGGIHYIYKYPMDGNRYGNKVGIDAGLDVRGEGGYIISYAFDNCPIAEAPQWLIDTALDNKVEHEVNQENVVAIDASIITEDLEKACENIRQAAEGESNDVLNTQSYSIGMLVGTGSLSYERAYEELFKAAKDRGKPDYEAKATIESGLKGGTQKPIECPFGNVEPVLLVPIVDEGPVNTRWTPAFGKRSLLTDFKKLRKPQLFKDWSTRDIELLVADGGTGKTTLKLNEAVALALGNHFLGHECMVESGRTLFITGEDDAGKLYAMLGAILKQMGLLDGKHEKEIDIILNNVIIKADTDLCLTTKEQGTGFMMLRPEALQNLTEAIEDLKPDMIVFDPIASFWGSEAGLNDMAKVVTKFMGVLVNMSDANVCMINHMGKDSSSKRDLTQFAGRGGSALPSHSRVSKVLAPLNEEDFLNETGGELEDNQSAMICNVNKFSDGSPLLNKPFAIVRQGFLFNKVGIIEQVDRPDNKLDLVPLIFKFIKDERSKDKYPVVSIVQSRFKKLGAKVTDIKEAIEDLGYEGFQGETVQIVEDPNTGKKAYAIFCQGVEI